MGLGIHTLALCMSKQTLTSKGSGGWGEWWARFVISWSVSKLRLQFAAFKHGLELCLSAVTPSPCT